MSSIRDGLVLKEREFTVRSSDGTELQYKTVRPNFGIGNKAEIHYKRAFAEALKERLLTSFEMRETLEKLEYFAENDDVIKEIDTEIEAQEAKIVECENTDEAAPIIAKLRILRTKRVLEVYKINSVYENTAESYAEKIRNQFYAAMLTRAEDGSKVWNSFEEFQEEEDIKLVNAAINNVMLLNAQVRNNFEMEYPENQWLVKHGIVDEEGNVIKAEEEEVVEEATPEVEETTEE